ncbi:endonuclease YncB(thermonuclease family) [Variovorax paradoxus]|uniref:thermonuclease family protein n=1 Tax=Variovorax atrisoli TaxID=3394203 RepID=UPI00119C7A70|nr:thermonuclease family protein [Variovorax paradoxus]MDR6524605.1 endonuclease YncB(thermonuclease family) [Variovorax paradoxus]
MKAGRQLLLGALLALPLLAAADVRTCLVVGVSDGDTITARCGGHSAYEQVKVRFNGIDAPEKNQPFGQRAKEAMSDLVYMKEVDLDCRKTDRYGRSVCRVRVTPNSAPNGLKTLDAGLAMITLGMAWWYRDYAREQTVEERAQYEFAESEAAAKGAGLLGNKRAMAPWIWRKEQRIGSKLPANDGAP